MIFLIHTLQRQHLYSTILSISRTKNDSIVYPTTLSNSITKCWTFNRTLNDSIWHIRQCRVFEKKVMKHDEIACGDFNLRFCDSRVRHSLLGKSHCEPSREATRFFLPNEMSIFITNISMTCITFHTNHFHFGFCPNHSLDHSSAPPSGFDSLHSEKSISTARCLFV